MLTAGICHSAATSTVLVSATILSKSVCKFNPGNVAALNFGILDSGTPVDKTVTASITFACRGSAPLATFFITDDDGMYETGANANRMLNTSVTTGNYYLPYSLTYNPQTGTVPKNVDQTLTITGTVLGTSYQNAYVGNYSDTVVLTISP